MAPARRTPTGRLSPPARDEGGYSLVEMTAVTFMAIVLAAAVTGILVVVINIISKTQMNAVTTATTQQALTSFEKIARNADSVQTATTTQLTLYYQRSNVCELHKYAIETDPNGGYRLQHYVTSRTLTTGNDCSSAKTFLSSAAVNTSITEVGTLSAAAFSYFGANGQRILVSGDTGYSADAVPTCKIGTVSLSVTSKNQNIGPQAQTKPESIAVAFRNNVIGLGC